MNSNNMIPIAIPKLSQKIVLKNIAITSIAPKSSITAKAVKIF
jgi:hypothetical protein